MPGRDPVPHTPAATVEALADLPALASVPRVARALGWTRSVGYRHAKAGHLPTVRYGSRLYVVVAKVRQQLEAA